MVKIKAINVNRVISSVAVVFSGEVDMITVFSSELNLNFNTHKTKEEVLIDSQSID